jgi:hypothetical protein
LTDIEKRRAVLAAYAAWLMSETASNFVVLRPAAVAAAG